MVTRTNRLLLTLAVLAALRFYPWSWSHVHLLGMVRYPWSWDRLRWLP